MRAKEINERLLPGKIYHVYNRAVGDELLFRTEESYYYFMDRMKRYILPFTKMYAYCLIPNHFHFLMRIQDEVDIEKDHPGLNIDLPRHINQAFSNFFCSYAISYNRFFKRKGKLFMLPYKRILVEDDHYFRSLVVYIHRNPIHHFLTNECSKWPYSSYNDILLNINENVDGNYVLGKFGNIKKFLEYHTDLTGQP